ncbi:MAG TPA: hypothetical protein VG253_01670, partial [Streptosporangiaceae bacterium]|nr:hypothetical protein [Streptosporangiaceae bacterium]
MSASDAAPLPRLGEVFFDVRGNSRSMRLSWYADTGVAVFSIWQGGTCTGTFRLPIDDLSRMVEALHRGPNGRGIGHDRARAHDPAVDRYTGGTGARDALDGEAATGGFAASGASAGHDPATMALRRPPAPSSGASHARAEPGDAYGTPGGYGHDPLATSAMPADELGAGGTGDPLGSYGTGDPLGPHGTADPPGARRPADPLGGREPADPLSAPRPADPLGGREPADPRGGRRPAGGAVHPRQPVDPLPTGRQPDPLGYRSPADPLSTRTPADPPATRAPADPLSPRRPAHPRGSGRHGDHPRARREGDPAAGYAGGDPGRYGEEATHYGEAASGYDGRGGYDG